MPLTKISKLTCEYRMALVNAIVFVLFSLAQAALAVESLSLVLLPNFIFLCGSIITWVRMMKSDWALTPICWFILGSGLYFGFGVIAGGMHAHPWSEMVYGDSVQHLLKANAINSTSVFCILLVATVFRPVSTRREEGGQIIDISDGLKYCFPYLSVLLLLLVISRFFFFQETDSFLIRNVLSKIYFILPSIFLITGLFYKDIRNMTLLVVALALFLQVCYGVLLFNKYEILTPVIAIMIGFWISVRSYKGPVALLLAVIAIFWVVNPIVGNGRLHHKYHASNNTLFERIEILTEILSNQVIQKRVWLNSTTMETTVVDADTHVAPIERIRAIGVRFDIASVQGFLIKEHDEGRPGKTLVDYWAVLIPRVIWPEKPVITRFGQELSIAYHNNDPRQGGSAMAPTYTGEAYWNMGWFGVLAISAYLGICYGLLSRPALAAAQGKNLAYLFIAYPLLISAAFVESWITATYIGGMAMIVLYYFAIKITLSMIARGHQSA